MFHNMGSCRLTGLRTPNAGICHWGAARLLIAFLVGFVTDVQIMHPETCPAKAAFAAACWQCVQLCPSGGHEFDFNTGFSGWQELSEQERERGANSRERGERRAESGQRSEVGAGNIEH